MQVSRVAKEIGPDEDHLLRKPLVHEVVDLDCPEVIRNSGVISVERTDPCIEKFLNDVPYIIKQNETHGLIWDNNLKPENFKYEKGTHFVSTRETDRKTKHATVSFYRDGVTGAAFAIKTLQKGTHFRQEEIKVGLTIQHPNICSVYGIIIMNGLIHILLEHAGSPLYEERTWIAECPKRIQSFAKQGFQALDIIHRHGFVHCDIKPDNIMIDRHNSPEFKVKLIDFGTCHYQKTSLPRNAHTTLLYWSPEIWQALENKNKIICTPAMDVYALALTLHFVHTSNHLMQRFENLALKNLMIEAPNDILFIALPETIPSDLSVVMKSCLDGDPEIRTSAQEALKQLADCSQMRRSLSNTGEENYKESFNRICSSISEKTKRARSDISNIVITPPTPSQMLCQISQEKGTFTSVSIGIEKREFKTTAKAKKSTCLPCNKFSKPSQKVKKCSRLHFKQNLQKVSQMPPETFQTPLMSDLEKGVELKPDDKDYCYSTLLKNLALRVKEPHQTGTSCLNNINSDNSGIVQYVMADKPAGKPIKLPSKAIEIGYVSKWTINQPDDRSYKFSGDKPELEVQDNRKFKNNKEMRAVENERNSDKDVHAEITDICSLAPCQSTNEPASRVEENNPRKDSESIHDDMEFVLCAFGDDVFTGADDEIVNNLYELLDAEEQTESRCSPSGSEMDMNIHQVSAVKQSQVLVIIEEEEPMDADQEESSSASKVDIRSILNLPAVKGSRKRIAEPSPNPSYIPGKAVFVPPLLQDRTTDLLPNFDQILPENC